MKEIVEYRGKKYRLESLQWHAKSYLMQFSDSLSMSKLEDKLKDANGSRLQYVSGGYLYFNKEKIDKLKYPSLYKIRKEFEEAIKVKDGLDSYFKVYHSIFVKSLSRERENEFKDNLRKEILKLNEYSYSSLAEASGVKKSNLYNYLAKSINSSLSVKKIKNIYKVVSVNE